MLSRTKLMRTRYPGIYGVHLIGPEGKPAIKPGAWRLKNTSM
jgi:hypothetical protein